MRNIKKKIKKKILIVLIMFLSAFLLTSCETIEQAFASFVWSIGRTEKNYEFVEGTFESDEVWYLTKEFEVEREDGTIESFKELKITKTKMTILRIEERQKLN